MTDANSPTQQLTRLEEQVADMSRTLTEMQGEVDAMIDALRAKLAKRGQTL